MFRYYEGLLQGKWWLYNLSSYSCRLCLLPSEQERHPPGTLFVCNGADRHGFCGLRTGGLIKNMVMQRKLFASSIFMRLIYKKPRISQSVEFFSRKRRLVKSKKILYIWIDKSHHFIQVFHCNCKINIIKSQHVHCNSNGYFVPKSRLLILAFKYLSRLS